MWLVIILVGITPNQVDIGEAAVTFALFPVMVGIAYLADRGFFQRKGSREEFLRKHRGDVIESTDLR